MSGFNDVLKSIGYAAGVATGGPSQIKAVAGAVAVQGKISAYLDSVGRKLGGIVGPDLFNKIAGGAEVTANQETRSFVTRNLTEPVKNKITIVLIIALAVVGYFFYKGGK